MIPSNVFIQIEESQERTSSMPSLWEIKIYSCENHYWSTVAYFVLYIEYGQLSELFNMDPLP